MNDEQQRASEDAMKGMDADSGPLVMAYFGSATVLIEDDDDDIHRIELNILMEAGHSYAEAVGTMFLQLQDQYPVEDGYHLGRLTLEEMPVYVHPDDLYEWTYDAQVEDDDEDDEANADADDETTEPSSDRNVLELTLGDGI